MYPVGSCYFSTVATSPATVIGGTWAAMTGGMLGLTGSTGVAGAANNGGSRKISVNQMPSHSHEIWTIFKPEKVVYHFSGASVTRPAPANRSTDITESTYLEAKAVGGGRTIFLHTPLFTVGDEQLSKVGEC